MSIFENVYPLDYKTYSQGEKEQFSRVRSKLLVTNNFEAARVIIENMTKDYIDVLDNKIKYSDGFLNFFIYGGELDIKEFSLTEVEFLIKESKDCKLYPEDLSSKYEKIKLLNDRQLRVYLDADVKGKNHLMRNVGVLSIFPPEAIQLDINLSAAKVKHEVRSSILKMYDGNILSEDEQNTIEFIKSVNLEKVDNIKKINSISSSISEYPATFLNIIMSNKLKEYEKLKKKIDEYTLEQLKGITLNTNSEVDTYDFIDRFDDPTGISSARTKLIYELSNKSQIYDSFLLELDEDYDGTFERIDFTNDNIRKMVTGSEFEKRLEELDPKSFEVSLIAIEKGYGDFMDAFVVGNIEAFDKIYGNEDIKLEKLVDYSHEHRLSGMPTNNAKLYLDMMELTIDSLNS
ncbi:MAG: hypothetical protein N4A47_07620 [Clostridia bacterium]|jgi:hypothetical protein|nr:hypothetical protein [Clostridia bacterium]